MFEDSLVESRVGGVSSSKRWTALASIGLQVAVTGIVIALPLLHPEALPFHIEPPKLLLPLKPKPPVLVHVQHAVASVQSAFAPPSSRALIFTTSLPGSSAQPDQAPSLIAFGCGMGRDGSLPSGLADRVSGPAAVTTIQTLNKPLAVSSGVSQGMLMAPIRPLYPTIARAAHVEGTVVVEAIISRIGTIESLHVVSGPVMLQNAALEAIRAARYKPYRLNGEATEVQTTITVNFRLGG